MPQRVGERGGTDPHRTWRKIPVLGKSPRSERSRLEGWLWLLVGWLVALVTTWPLARRLRTTVPVDLGDSLAQAWSVAWGGHAVRAQPLHLFEGNVGWPAGPSLAFTDSLLGYLPAALIGRGPDAALVRYNLLFLFTFALAFAAAALLGRELGCSLGAAAVVGAAFAYAPWRLTQLNHLNVLSTGGVALALFLLLSGYRRDRPWQVLAGWLAAAWQVSLGFALGIWFCYLLAGLALGIAVVWLLRGRPPLPRVQVTATVTGGIAFLLVVGVLVQPYLGVIADDPGATRSVAELASFSPPPQGFLAAGEFSRAWAAVTSPARETLRWSPEMALFPGVTTSLLAVLGVTWRGAGSRVRLALALGVALTALLSLGLGFFGGALYRPLYENLPGWSGIRTPGRLAFLWTLLLALLAGAGISRIQSGASQVTSGRKGVASVAAFLLAAAVVLEGAPKMPLIPVPARPTALDGLPAPQVHLPSDSYLDSRYMLWSTAGFPRIVNDNAAYIPVPLQQVRALHSFPDRPSIRFLRTLGYRTVVLHRDLAAGTPWADSADKDVAGLGIRRRVVDQLVVFDLSR